MSSKDLDQTIIEPDSDHHVDLDFLTPEEKDVILAVLARDENLKRKDEERIERLKREIRELRAEEFSRISFDAARLCGRCLQEFHWLFNRGQICSKCRLRVCKKCRQLLNNKTWMCLVCLRILELETQTGKWFYANYPQNKRNMSSCQIISALDLLRSSLNQFSEPNGDATLPNGQFRNHVTSMRHLQNAFPMSEDDEELEKMSDSDSLSNKFHFSSTPNLSIRSSDKGSLTNLYVTDVNELQEELPSHATGLSAQQDKNVFDLGNVEVALINKHLDPVEQSNNLSSSILLTADHYKPLESGGANGINVQAEDVNKTFEDSMSIKKNQESISTEHEASSRSVKIVVAEEEDLQNDTMVVNEAINSDEDNEAKKATSEDSSSQSPGASSDAVRLKVSALLAKYGRQEVTTSYSTIYKSILNTNPDGDTQNKDEHGNGNDLSSPNEFPKTSLISKTKDDFLTSEPVKAHTLDRKYRSVDGSNFILDTHDPLGQQSGGENMDTAEDNSPAMESLGTEDDDDNPLRRFLKNEALLQKQHGDDCGFSSAVSWVTGKSYDLDWEASDEEAPFSIHDFDHISTGFLDDDEDGSKGAFSDLRSVIDDILWQSPHDKSDQEDYEDEEVEEETGDTVQLPISSSLPVRNGIPMLRRKSLSVISEHTEPSACSSFDESSFAGEFQDKEETHQYDSTAPIL